VPSDPNANICPLRPLETRDEALRLVATGLNDCEIARRLDLPRTTVRDWRKPRYVPRRSMSSRCPLCGDRSRPIALAAEPYAELFGLYLGDGHITDFARTQRIRLFLDARYPTIVDDAEHLIRTMLPGNRVGRMAAEEGRMAVVWSYSSHLSCLFPQHGDGKKHDRPIVLEPWQRELVAAAPWALLRGLIRSDGCVFVNRTGRYEYLSYEFANLSSDILDLCEETSHGVGLRPRRYARALRFYRRDCVALLHHVGTKS
jgi:hypothetical protein